MRSPGFRPSAPRSSVDASVTSRLDVPRVVASAPDLNVNCSPLPLEMMYSMRASRTAMSSCAVPDTRIVAVVSNTSVSASGSSSVATGAESTTGVISSQRSPMTSRRRSAIGVNPTRTVPRHPSSCGARFTERGVPAPLSDDSCTSSAVPASGPSPSTRITLPASTDTVSPNASVRVGRFVYPGGSNVTDARTRPAGVGVSAMRARAASPFASAPSWRIFHGYAATVIRATASARRPSTRVRRWRSAPAAEGSHAVCVANAASRRCTGSASLARSCSASVTREYFNDGASDSTQIAASSREMSRGRARRHRQATAIMAVTTADAMTSARDG